MKCDSELYCWLLDWREEMRRAGEGYRACNPERWKDKQTIMDEFAEEVNDVLAKADKSL